MKCEKEYLEVSQPNADSTEKKNIAKSSSLKRGNHYL
jgi:hypothetical protein